MNLNNEIITKGPCVVEAEITSKLGFYKYVSLICVLTSLAFCVMYSHERELSKAKSTQIQQKDVTITEKSNQIKILEEFNINLSKTK